ncbi:unnamed protein product [Caenorhabditis angaria]|uniref:BTB domain-containing protein n=1 Tax=Caenorhabditis angaria TaxID=860376 RepID=A0A9P1I7A8_9PELO|nr:unnamed protein product [Caenorhabditis angaria]
MPQKIRGIISMNFVYPYKSKNVSETKMIGNLPWYISHNFQTISGQDYLSIYLSCKNSSHLWSCNAQVEIRLLPREQKPGLVKTFEHVYNAKLKGYGFRQFVAKSELQPMVVSSGTYETHTIEVSIVLSNVRGVLNVQSIDFSEDQGEHNYFSDDHLSNITFIFKENEVTQKLYANKTYLALHSPVFRAMFSSNFTEQNAEQIVLADNFDEFHELLHVIYPTRKSITEENVESLIRLADKYRIAQVMLECERFLIESQKVGVVRKLIISDDLGLAKLQDYVLQNLVQIEQLTALRETEDYEKLSEATFPTPNSTGKWDLLYFSYCILVSWRQLIECL